MIVVNSVTRRTLQKPKKGDEWLCPGCKMLNQEPATSCHACLARSNPRLTPEERALATVFEPDDLAVQIWHGYRGMPANDKQLLGSLAAICEDDACCHTDLGPYCWAERDGEIEIWAGRETPGDDVEALDKLAVLNAIRSIYQIPPAKEPASGIKAVGAWQCPHCPVTRGWNDAELTRCHSCGRARPDANEEAHAKSNGKPPKPAEASAEPSPPDGVESDVAIGDIIVGDKNPRIHFDEAKLQEAAESLKKHGQLQNLVVWQPDRLKGKYELIAGERRLRAGKIAGRPTMRCRILLGITEEQATELRGIENLIREDLSAIETARWYQQMLELTKLDGSKLYTQASLAERLKCSQPTIANRLRLLRLPDEWQQRVIRREISESHALELVAWSDLPEVLAACAKDLENEDGEAPPLKTWRNWVQQNVNSASRPMTPGQHYSINTGRNYEWGNILFSAEDVERLAEQLDVRTIDGFNGPEKRAFNVKEWDKLHGKLKAKQAREQQKKANEPAAKEDTPQAKAAQLKADRARQARNLASDLETYWVRWHEEKIAEAARSSLAGDALLRLLIAVAVADDWNCHDPFETALNKLKVPKARTSAKGVRMRIGPLLERIGQAKNVEALLRETIASKMQSMDDTVGFEGVALLAGVELAKSWTVDREFLEMHAVWQLKELAEKWKLAIEFDDPVKETPAAKKKAIERILAAAKSKRLPVPKALIEARP
jgi:ParB/RepB/Spo0J family partition protein